MSNLVKETITIARRWSWLPSISVEITCAPDLSPRVKLGLAVKVACEQKISLDAAVLTDADLTDAVLTRAVLTRAVLTDEQLRGFKADLFLTLSSLRAGPLEAVHLVQKLRAGEVDGSTYGDHGGNRCACLVGTIAGARGLSGNELDNDAGRPAERWFMMIQPGDMPGSESGGGFAAQKALEWTLDWCASMGIDPDAPLAPPVLAEAV